VAIQSSAQTNSQPTSLIEGLIRERGLQYFGLFFVTGEGEDLPNGDEEQSGYVIDDQGQIYSFWTGWDDTREQVTFSEWELVDEEPDWRGVGEYERARARVGLAPTAK
jgi:hypothetical protein